MKKTGVSEQLSSFLRDFWGKPGAIWHDAELSIQKMVARFVEGGRLTQEQGRSLINELVGKVQNNQNLWEKGVDKFISERIPRVSSPEKDELAALRHRVNTLIDRADELEEKLVFLRKTGEKKPADE